jgi:hypothetical protein
MTLPVRPSPPPSSNGRIPTPGSATLARPTLLALLLLLVLPLAAGAQNTATLRGEVRSDGSGRSLAGASVEVNSGSWARAATTDALGRYTIREVPTGVALVRVRHLGHATLELQVLLPAGREVGLDLVLPLEPLALAPVTVEANSPRSAADSMPATAPQLGVVRARALESTPGLTELGISDAIRGIPGREPAEPGSILYIRGAAADLKLVYLDGAPVYAPFPLGGILEPFAPGLLQDAQIYLGGAPARFDGGLSHVMDLRTRSGRGAGVHASGSVDLLSAQMIAEGGLAERVSVLASGRALHPLAEASLFRDALPYGYREGIVRMDARVGATGLITLTGFANDEVVHMSEAPAAGRIEWGNTAGALRYRGTIGETTVDFTAARGEYAAHVPILGTRPLTAGGAARRSRFAGDFSRRLEGVLFRFGGSVDHQEHHASARVIATGSSAGTLEGIGTAAGVYAEGSGRLGDRVLLRAGGRLDSFSGRTTPTVAPRLATTLLLTDRAALTIAVGRYHQFLRGPHELLLQHAEAPLASGRVDLEVGQASHFTVALDHELVEGTHLGLEAFYKDFSRVPGRFSTEANASGADLWVRRETGRWRGSLGYSLSWAWSSGSPDRSADFVGRHLLSTGVEGTIFGNTGLDLRFAYGAGIPYTGIPLAASERQSAAPGYARTSPTVTAAQRGGTESAPLLHNPDEPFLRLDASLSRSWSPRLGDRSYEITPYIRLLNGFGNRDALFYYFDHHANERPRAIGSFPVLPVVGMEWRF